MTNISAGPAAIEIAIIIPAFNARSSIAETILSVQNQSFSRWECLVIDDGSTDDTADFVNSCADQRVLLVAQSNAGVSAARNKGLSLTRAPYVLFLDADDLLHPTALERLRSGLEQEPEAVAVYGSFRKILRYGQPYPGEKPLARLRYPSGDVLDSMLRENFLANGGHVLVRTNAARAAGAFDVDLRLSEDWEFWCRLALKGKFNYVDLKREVLYFRIDPRSTSGNLAVEWRNHQAALCAVFDNPEIRARYNRRNWNVLRRQIRASHCWEAGRVNFTHRRFSQARAMMICALVADLRPKRLAMFIAAQISQISGRSLISRLRFRSDDALEPAELGDSTKC